MAAQKKPTILKSPLTDAMNNIVNISRSKSAMNSTQRSYNNFLRFMDIEIKSLEAIKLPKKKQLDGLSTINVASSFGKVGGFLGSLVGGSLDLAGFIGNFFRGKNKQANPSVSAAPKPKVSSGKLKISGLRAIGITNAIFSGLDFATGLAEGESVGKSAAGAGGALAGGLLGGAIGQMLIPVPGVGFVLGSMAGNFLGGYLADRSYEAVTGEGKTIAQKTKERLKKQEEKQKISAAATAISFPEVVDKFDNVVAQFERLSNNIAVGNFESSSAAASWDMGETTNDQFDYTKDGEDITLTGTGNEIFPLPSGNPQFNTTTGNFYSMRDGGKRQHKGQDIGVDPNSPVVASRNGTVLNAYSSGYGAVGGAVIIKYDNGQQGLYGHVFPNVKPGDKVQAGEKIARVAPDGGNTHLHYMRKDTRGGYIDPLPYLKSSQSGVPQIKPQKVDQTLQDQLGKVKMPDSGDLSQKEIDKQQRTLRGKPTVSGQNLIQSPEKPATSSEGLSPSDILMSMIQPQMSQSMIIPQMIEQYPDYNMPQSSITLMPIMTPGGGQQQRPIVISGGGGGSKTVIMPPVPEGHLLNSLFKTMLLTNLSST